MRSRTSRPAGGTTKRTLIGSHTLATSLPNSRAVSNAETSLSILAVLVATTRPPASTASSVRLPTTTRGAGAGAGGAAGAGPGPAPAAEPADPAPASGHCLTERAAVSSTGVLASVRTSTRITRPSRSGGPSMAIVTGGPAGWARYTGASCSSGTIGAPGTPPSTAARFGGPVSSSCAGALAAAVSVNVPAGTSIGCATRSPRAGSGNVRGGGGGPSPTSFTTSAPGGTSPASGRAIASSSRAGPTTFTATAWSGPASSPRSSTVAKRSRNSVV